MGFFHRLVIIGQKTEFPSARDNPLYLLIMCKKNFLLEGLLLLEKVVFRGGWGFRLIWMLVWERRVTLVKMIFFLLKFKLFFRTILLKAIFVEDQNSADNYM